MALGLADQSKARSVQQDVGVLGASDAGGCRHRAVLTVRRTPPTDVVKKGKALIGSALHEGFLPALHEMNSDMLVENINMPDLICTLPSGFTVPVHPDLIDPSEPSVTDAKFTDHIHLMRKQGPSDKHMMQRHMQALAAHQAGVLPDLSAVITRNVYGSMTDADDVFVHQSVYDPEWIERADQWFSDVRYAIQHEEDGAKEGQPHFCGNFCPFVSMCKPPVYDSEQRITNPTLAALVDLAAETRRERKALQALEEESVAVLKGLTGRTERTRITSTKVNGSRPHTKVALEEI